MEKKHDNLEDLFRKSLENYSVPGLRPWQEERKLLEERKRKRRRRPGYWPYLLATLFLIGTFWYVGVPDPDRRSHTDTDRSKVKANRFPTDKAMEEETLAGEYRKPPPPGIDSIGNTQNLSIKNTESSLRKVVETILSERIGEVFNDEGPQSDGRIPTVGLSREGEGNPNSLIRQDSFNGLPNDTFTDRALIGKSVLLLNPPEFRIKNTLALPELNAASFPFLGDTIDDAAGKEDSSLPTRNFRVFSLGALVGGDHLALPRSADQGIEFSATGFLQSPSISLAGFLQLSPRLMIRSGIDYYLFRERLNANVHRTITDIVYTVREKPGDVTYTESDRQVRFDSSYQFDNRYSVLGVPVLAGYTLPFGKGNVSLLAGVVANFQLKQTGVVSTEYLISSQMVNDYTDGMDPDLEGYIHYERYNEYSGEFAPIESKVKPLSLLVDFRAMGRWTLKSNLDLCAEISYRQGITPFFAGNPSINPVQTGVKIGVLYSFRKVRIPKTQQK